MPWALLPVGALLIVPLTLHPTAGVAIVGAALLVFLASRGLAYPLGLAGFAAPVIAVVGHDPFPHNFVPIVVCAWIAVALGFEARRGRLTLRSAVTPAVGLSLAILALMLARLPSSTDLAYGETKIQLFVLGNLTLVIAGSALVRRPHELDRFLLVALALDAVSGILVVRQFGVPGNPSNRFALPDQNAIALGAQGAEGLLIATYLMLNGRSRRHRIAAFLLLPPSLVALLASGSRGPVLGAVVGLGALLVLHVRTRTTALHVLAVGAAFTAMALVAADVVPHAASQRALSTLSGGSQGLSGNGRDQLWPVAWQAFATHPLAGIGTGSFATQDRSGVCPGPGCLDRYPHNVLLETAAELGVLGLLATLAFLLLGAAVILVAWRRAGPTLRPRVAVVCSLFVASVTAAMLTGDIGGDAGVWLAAGIGTGLLERTRRAQRADS